jgi:hypothetical protein
VVTLKVSNNGVDFADSSITLTYYANPFNDIKVFYVFLFFCVYICINLFAYLYIYLYVCAHTFNTYLL